MPAGPAPITTGRSAKGSLPGVWRIELRLLIGLDSDAAAAPRPSARRFAARRPVRPLRPNRRRRRPTCRGRRGSFARCATARCRSPARRCPGQPGRQGQLRLVDVHANVGQANRHGTQKSDRKQIETDGAPSPVRARPMRRYRAPATFHSKMPLDLLGCSSTSNRRPPVVTVRKVSRLKRSISISD